MDNTFKKWELALMAGLMVGLLSTPAAPAQLPLSRWQEQETQMRYQVSLFPFAFAQEKTTVMAAPDKGEQRPYEIDFKLVQWLEALVGQNPVFSHSCARE